MIEHSANDDSEEGMELLRRIERYIRRRGMPPTRFGQEAVGDPRFVWDLRRGRQPRGETVRRVAAWLDRHERGRLCRR